MQAAAGGYSDRRIIRLADQYAGGRIYRQGANEVLVLQINLLLLYGDAFVTSPPGCRAGTVQCTLLYKYRSQSGKGIQTRYFYHHKLCQKLAWGS